MDWGVVIGIGGGLLAVWALLLVVLWFARPRDVRLGAALRVVPDVLRLARGLVTDRTAPAGVRLALVGLAVWLVSPIELVPEFLPVIGPLDDVVVAVLVLRYVRRRLGDDEFRRRWPGTEDGFRPLSGDPRFRQHRWRWLRAVSPDLGGRNASHTLAPPSPGLEILHARLSTTRLPRWRHPSDN